MVDKEIHKKLLGEQEALHGTIHEFVIQIKKLKDENEELKKNQCECSPPIKSDAESEEP